MPKIVLPIHLLRSFFFGFGSFESLAMVDFYDSIINLSF